MKFKYHILGLTLTSLALTACVDETFVEPEEPVWQQGDIPYYITLKLKPSSETFTRAEGEGRQFENFAPGDHDYEHAISPNAYNFAIFFDVNDKFISCADLYSVNEVAAWEDGNTAQNIPATESTYKCRFYGFADSEPAKVLVVVNAPKKIYDQVTDFPGWNLEEVMKNQVWNEPGILNFDSNGNLQKDSEGKVHKDDPRDNMGFYVEGSGGSKTRYFTMTNSTYLTQQQDGSFKLNCAQAFPTGSVTTDPNEIRYLTPVTVYLERMVSKFQLTAAFDVSKYIPTNAQALDVCKYDDNGDFTYSAYNWGIQLLSWGMNGLETSNYLFKNVPYEGEELTPSLSNLYNSGWNSAYNRRCFWSRDPHYKTVDEGAAYPWQFDDARDKFDSQNAYYTHFQSYDNPDSRYALAYYPFQSFCLNSNGEGSFVNDKGIIDPSFSYQGDKLTLYTPENTFMPGLIVDRSRGSRAYELAGTHILLCARLLLTDDENFSGNIYKNRVGVSYVDEKSMFEDFMNTVNYQLNSQKYLYYKYYDWNNSEEKDDYLGHTIRARSEGDYALYCYFPYNTKNTTIENLITEAFGDNKNWQNGVIIELTHDLITRLNSNTEHYQLYRDADAINADGKIIPWIMYRDNNTSAFTPLRLMIIERQPEDVTKYDFIGNYNYGKSSNPGAEFIFGDPEDKSDINSVGTYLSGTQGNRVGLSTWGTSVTFDNFKVTTSQGEFSDDFSNSNTINTNWKKENTATTGTGNWTVRNGILSQTNENMEGEILTMNQTFPRSYTIEVDATVTGGREGFLIVFNYSDENNYCWWNVGAWGNSRHELEHVKDGKKTYFEAKYESLKPNTPYHAKVEVAGSNVKCYLDGVLIHDMNLPLGRELQFEAWETIEGTSDNYAGDDNDVQSIFFETWGVVDCFKNGLMYYAVPIHAQDQYGKPAIDENARLEDGINPDFSGEEKLKYYYGVVRNNWYKFSLHSINDIGIPVYDPTKPIVPNYDGKLDQNKVEMEILQWHMEDQTVDIPFDSD